MTLTEKQQVAWEGKKVAKCRRGHKLVQGANKDAVFNGQGTCDGCRIDVPPEIAYACAECNDGWCLKCYEEKSYHRGYETWRYHRERFPDWKSGDKIPKFPIGKQYQKSGWMVKEPEHKGFFFHKRKRWFQLRHHYLFYYSDTDEQDGYNDPEPGVQEEKREEKNLLDFDFDIKLPSLPSLPSLHLPGMPSLHVPDVHMPSMHMPSLSMPSLSMPSLSMPTSIHVGAHIRKMPWHRLRKKVQPDPGKPYGLIIVYGGPTVKRKGKDIIMDGCQQTKFFKTEPNEDKKNQHFELHCEDVEEAKSWYLSLVWGGAKAGGES
jgi:hypothetical protein